MLEYLRLVGKVGCPLVYTFLNFGSQHIAVLAEHGRILHLEFGGHLHQRLEYNTLFPVLLYQFLIFRCEELGYRAHYLFVTGSHGGKSEQIVYVLYGIGKLQLLQVLLCRRLDVLRKGIYLVVCNDGTA